jgi:uncharacterized membrane protein
MSCFLNKTLRLLILASIVLGLVFRFADIGKKVYWGDEIFSAFRTFGFSTSAVVRESAGAQNASQLRAVLHPTFAQRGGAGRTIATLAAEEPQHPPLYFVLANGWSRVFGTSIAAFRTLSAVFSVLSLPAMYWLGLELFGPGLATWLAVALLALSPIQVIYAQEFREYSLWTLATIVLTACLLRAMRVWNASTWAVYGFVFAVNLYVYPPSGAIAAAQLLFAVAYDRSGRRRLVYPLAAGALGLALFSPWLVAIVRGLRQVAWMMRMVDVPRVSPLQTLRSFLSAARLDLFDFNVLGATTVNALLALPAISLIVYAAYVTYRRAPIKVWGIIFITIAACVLPVVVPDLVGTGIRTTQIRYYLPFYVATDLAIAFAIAFNVTNGPLGWRRAWTAVLTAVFAIRLGSLVASSRADTWWNKIEEQSKAIARVINATPDAAIVMGVNDDNVARALSIAQYLRGDIPTRLADESGPAGATEIPTAGLSGKHIFIVSPSNGVTREMDAVPHATVTCIVDEDQNCPDMLQLWKPPQE